MDFLETLGDIIKSGVGASPTEMFHHVLGRTSPMSSYPTNEDAAFAKNAGFGYGSGYEGFLSGDVGKILNSTALGNTPGDLARWAGNAPVSYLKGDEKQEYSDVMTRAALAANRIPIAALGFDPRVMGINLAQRGTTLGGSYVPGGDAIYVAPNNSTGAALHESLHRGIEKLREAGDKDAMFLNGVGWDRKSLEETTVRYIMSIYGGDEERQFLGDKAVNEARDYVINNPQMLTAVTRMMMAAQEKMAKDKPRGPR